MIYWRTNKINIPLIGLFADVFPILYKSCGLCQINPTPASLTKGTAMDPCMWFLLVLSSSYSVFLQKSPQSSLIWHLINLSVCRICWYVFNLIRFIFPLMVYYWRFYKFVLKIVSSDIHSNNRTTSKTRQAHGIEIQNNNKKRAKELCKIQFNSSHA